MNPRITSYIFALAVALLFPSLLQAQPGEARVRVPPALVGSNGRVLVGTQAGKIFRATLGSNNSISIDTASAGLDLPDEVTAVWTLTLPDPVNAPDRIVGLVSYSSGTVRDYGIVRSSNFGATWELLKPAALLSPVFTPSNDWVIQPLSEIAWLADGMNGWIWGRYGIVRTTDGGATWETMRADNAAAQHLWGLDFKSLAEGAAVIGIRGEMYYNNTTDGGRTWTRSNRSVLLPKRIIRLDYIGGEYRAFVFDRNQLRMNTYMYFSQDGIEYPVPQSSYIRTISREQTHMSELLWADSATGYMVLRSGDIFRTNDAGRTWENFQAADSVAYPIIVNQNVGFGQRSILLDNRAIIHVSTLTATGTIYRLLRWPLVTAGAPPGRAGNLGAAITLLPNPAIGRTMLEIDLQKPSALRLRVIDMLGREHRQHDLPVSGAGMLRMDLDLAGLPPGAYRIMIEGENLRAEKGLLIAR